MIFIALNVLFNALLLSIAFSIIVGFSSMNIPIYYIFMIGYFISGALTIIGYTKFASAIVGFFIGGRKLVGREMARVKPLLNDVIKKCNASYGTNYSIEDFVLRVTDSKVINAYALGHNLICIDSGSFEGFNDEQLSAILAHEVGHLFYKDSVKSIALIFSSVGTRVIMWLYSIVVAVQAVVASIGSNMRDKDGIGAMVALASFIPLLMFIPIIILNWVGNKVFHLINMAISRKAEYRADAFAASIGYQGGMIEALEILNGVSVIGNSFIDKLVATHPAPMQRIGALEDGREIQITSAGYKGLSDFALLSMFIVGFGVAWCGYLTYVSMQDTTNNRIKKNNTKLNAVTHKHVHQLQTVTDSYRQLHQIKIQECSSLTREKFTKVINGYNVVFKDGKRNITTKITHSKPNMGNYTI